MTFARMDGGFVVVLLSVWFVLLVVDSLLISILEKYDATTYHS